MKFFASVFLAMSAMSANGLVQPSSRLSNPNTSALGAFRQNYMEGNNGNGNDRNRRRSNENINFVSPQNQSPNNGRFSVSDRGGAFDRYSQDKNRNDMNRFSAENRYQNSNSNVAASINSRAMDNMYASSRREQENNMNMANNRYAGSREQENLMRNMDRPMDRPMDPNMDRRNMDPNMDRNMDRRPMDPNMDRNMGRRPMDPSMDPNMGRRPMDPNMDRPMDRRNMDRSMNGNMDRNMNNVAAPGMNTLTGMGGLVEGKYERYNPQRHNKEGIPLPHDQLDYGNPRGNMNMGGMNRDMNMGRDMGMGGMNRDMGMNTLNARDSVYDRDYPFESIPRDSQGFGGSVGMPGMNNPRYNSNINGNGGMMMNDRSNDRRRIAADQTNDMMMDRNKFERFNPNVHRANGQPRMEPEDRYYAGSNPEGRFRDGSSLGENNLVWDDPRSMQHQQHNMRPGGGVLSDNMQPGAMQPGGAHTDMRGNMMRGPPQHFQIGSDTPDYQQMQMGPWARPDTMRGGKPKASGGTMGGYDLYADNWWEGSKSKSDRRSQGGIDAYDRNVQQGRRTTLERANQNGRVSGSAQRRFEDTFRPGDRNMMGEDYHYGPRYLSGGKLERFSFDPSVSSVLVELWSEGLPIQATVEVLQEAGKRRQSFPVFVEDGYNRPYSTVLDLPGYSGGTVLIRNDGPLEYPITAHVQPNGQKGGMNNQQQQMPPPQGPPGAAGGGGGQQPWGNSRGGW